VYIGHAALALLAKAERPRVPIALLVPLAFAPDWLEGAADLFGSPNAKLLSHSLVSVAIGATVVGLLYWAVSRQGLDALVVGATYASHWPADFITGIKPTWPHGPIVGLELYDHLIADVVLESAIVLAVWIVYRRTLPASVRARRVLWIVPLGLVAMQALFGVAQHPGFLLER
jgi:hypothetical protein